MIDIIKTEKYYASLTADQICDCCYCSNYVSKVKEAYPELAAYLKAQGIDIEKPYETVPLEPYDGHITYAGVQYLVLGDSMDYVPVKIGDTDIVIADSYPYTDLAEEHFVIEISPIILSWQEK